MSIFRFATDGYATVAELDGKTIGTGIRNLEYYHEGGEHAKLKMELDLHDFQFLPDGEFDERFKKAKPAVPAAEQQEREDISVEEVCIGFPVIDRPDAYAHDLIAKHNNVSDSGCRTE